jgi:hypothetical protein
MAFWAAVAILAYTVLNTTLVRYQRFTTDIARAASDELGGNHPRQVRALQSLMTPILHSSLSWLCYVVLAISFVLAFRATGWIGAGFILGWAILSATQLTRIWPLPTTPLSARVAAAEVRRGGKLPQLEPDEREMVTKLLLQRLEPLERAPVS